VGRILIRLMATGRSSRVGSRRCVVEPPFLEDIGTVADHFAGLVQSSPYFFTEGDGPGRASERGEFEK